MTEYQHHDTQGSSFGRRGQLCASMSQQAFVTAGDGSLIKQNDSRLAQA